MRFGILLTVYICLLCVPFQTWAQCEFTISNSTPCAAASVNFSLDSPTGGAIYEWDFDEDGNIDLSGTAVDYSFPEAFADSVYTITVFEDGVPCNSQDITVLAIPDATIGVPPGIFSLLDNEIKACNGSASIDLEIFNASTTFSDNATYNINWGDGTPTETFDNTTFSQTSTISHTYNGFGYYTLFITVTHQNGCLYTNTYTFYNGGNPSVGIVIPGNTVGLCAPATLEFPISNTQNNPPGTEYTIFVNGEEVASFTQDDLPPTFAYTFEETSCGNTTSTGNYENAFDVKIVASNPCNSSTATIEPIEVSEPPTPEFIINTPSAACPGSVVGFENTTEDIAEVLSGNPSSCVDILNPSWNIIGGTPGTDWEVVSGSLFGSQNVEILFMTPGVYTIEMTIVSFACGTFTFSQDLTIVEPPVVVAEPTGITPDGNGYNGCVPVTVPFTNNSDGIGLTYTWEIDPPTGWEFANGTDSTSQNAEITFTEGGSYNISLIVANDCEEVTWDTILNFQGPPNLFLDEIPDSCLTATLHFSPANLNYDMNGDSITAVSWNFPGGTPSSSDQAYPGAVFYDTPGTYTINLTAENACGLSNLEESFIVQQQETLTMPPDFEICINEEPVQLTADPSTGNWIGDAITGGGLFDPSLAMIGINELTYRYGTGACLSESTMEVLVHDLPVVEAGPLLTACVNDTEIPLSGNPSGGQWTSPGGIVNNDLFEPAASGVDTFLLLYNYTDVNGCTNQDSTNINVLPLPVLAIPDTTFCDAPGNVNLPEANLPGGSWSGPGLVGNSGVFDPALTAGQGDYTLTYTYIDNNGCANSYDINVSIEQPPLVDAGDDQSFCITEGIINLEGSPAGGAWVGPGVINGPGGLFDPAVAGAGNHSLIYRFGQGTCQVRDTLQIEVIDLTNTAAGPDQDACQQDAPFTLIGNSPLGGVWGGPGVTDPLSGEFDPSAAAVGSNLITYTITDADSGCSFAAEKEVIVHPMPVPAFEIPPIACISDTIQPINQSTGGDSFLWSFGDGTTSNQTWPTQFYQDTGSYVINLQTTTNFGCMQEIEQPIFIADVPAPDFLPDAEEGCAILEVNYQDLSSGYDFDYTWDFGNGQTLTNSQPGGPIAYGPGINDTTYLVELSLTNLCGTRIHKDTITVFPFPDAAFGIEVDTGCAPIEVVFNNISIGSATSFSWDFGNGNSSTDSLPAPQLYVGDTTIVSYTITLIAENTCGADTIQQQVTVEPEFVTAFFNTSNTEGCAPFTVEFEDFSTFGTFVSWDFGDGNLVSVEDPIHTFTDPGVYTVMQYASNSCASDSAQVDIEVLPVPEVSFVYQDILCSGQEVSFSNTSPDLAGSIWDFGDGNSSILSNPVHVYDQAGTYLVSLTGFAPQTGCSQTITETITLLAPPEADFSLADPDGCTPHTVPFGNNSQNATYYFWDFGDGNTSAQASPTHTYIEPGTYDVTLIVTDQQGCTDTVAANNLFAYPIPEAAFSFDQESICGVPVNVSFINETSGGDEFVWNFGDGGLSNFTNPTNTYEEPGNFTIQLAANNQYGCTDTIEQDLTTYLQPIADFDIIPGEGCEPMEVSFVSLAVDVTDHFWIFGDGNQSIDLNPEHIYTEAGTYDVSLVVGYEDACFDTLTFDQLIEVQASPFANFDWTLNPPGEPQNTLQFLNLSTDANAYFWDFGDGTVSQEENPIHRFTTYGPREILLEATASNGCVDDTVLVFTPPVVGTLYIPNAFTPTQGDAEVSTFLPKGIGLKEYKLDIFSTYGELIWSTTELADGQPAVGWDGTYNGHLLPQDTYVWKVWAVFEDGREWPGAIAKDGKFKRIGAVVLIR